MKLEELQEKISNANVCVLDANAIIDSRPAKYALGFDVKAGVLNRDYQRLYHAKNDLKELINLLSINFPKHAPLTEKQKIRKEQRSDMLSAAKIKLEIARENARSQEIAQAARVEVERIKAVNHNSRQQELVRRLRAYVGNDVFLSIAALVNQEIQP
tara:strand:+ start:256 stop:726 length:471 start_codon:yes stop_codon:yes gene_type:complete